MGTTARLGIPYPEGTEPFKDGNEAMQAMVEHVDSLATCGALRRVASGSGNLPNAPSAHYSMVTVTFPAGRFWIPPTFVGVTLAMNTTGGHMYGVGGVTATGFNAIGGFNSGTGTNWGPGTFYWFAVIV